MVEKELYQAPQSECMDVRYEGVICASGDSEWSPVDIPGGGNI